MSKMKAINEELITQAKTIFETMVFNKITATKISDQLELNNDHIAASIDISCDYNGAGEQAALFVISFPKEVYLKAANAMLMEDETEINDDNDEVGLELANMIAGQAKAAVNDLGTALPMASPFHFKKEQIEEMFPEKYSIISNTLTSNLGDFFINIYHL